MYKVTTLILIAIQHAEMITRIVIKSGQNQYSLRPLWVELVQRILWLSGLMFNIQANQIIIVSVCRIFSQNPFIA